MLSSARKGDDTDEDEETKRFCRYCFDDDAQERLITPCSCCGDQKYVHLSCLRRWQRMELVNQPAHPLFWTERERYKICGVCKGKFSCDMPTYYDLFESFTGKEIGNLIRPLSVIGASTLFDRVCKMYITWESNKESTSFLYFLLTTMHCTCKQKETFTRNGQTFRWRH